MKARAVLMVGLLGCLTAHSAFGTTLVRLSLEQLSQASTAIVRARVLGQESRWTPDQTRIVTLTTVAVDQAIKGHPEGTLVVEQPGGTVGNVHVHVAGTVLFRSQAEYLLFLEPTTTNPAQFQPVGMLQGAFRFFRDGVTHQERLVLPLGSLQVTTRGPGVPVPSSAQSVPFSTFREILSGALEAPPSIPRGTRIPLVIESTEPEGAGQLTLVGRTTAALYPSSAVVVPSGSRVSGTARLIAGKWKIEWTSVSIRGVSVGIRAGNDEPAGAPLRGRALFTEVR